MKKIYQSPAIEVWDLKALDLMDNKTLVGVHSKQVNQNPKDNSLDEGTFAKEGLLTEGWGEGFGTPMPLWDD